MVKDTGLIRLLFLSNLPTPYQIDFLDRLSDQAEVRAIFLWSREENRDWSLGKRPWLHVLGPQGMAPRWQKLKRLVDEFNPDAVVVGGYSLPLATRLKFHCYKKQLRYYYWLEKPLPSRGLKALLRPLAWRLTLPFARGVICIGSEAVHAYGNFARRVANLPYSINTGHYNVRSRSAFASPLRFLFVGQFIDRKGVVDLLEAFASIAPCQGTLSMYGSGPLLPVVNEYADRYQHIRNCGFIEPDALAAKFSEHDVFVLPSRHDGWAVVVTEAMAAALAVIGTRQTGAFVDLIAPNECGVACEVNADSIKRAIRYYIENPGKVELHGQVGRRVLLSSSAEANIAAKQLLEFIDLQ